MQDTDMAYFQNRRSRIGGKSRTGRDAAVLPCSFLKIIG